MTGARFQVDARAVTRGLKDIESRILNPPMAQVGEIVRTEVDLAFRRGADPYGTPWEPLSETTKKRRRGSSAQVLRDTGRLADSIAYRASRDFVDVGTNVIYAGTHQFGAKKGQYGAMRNGAPIPWGDIPARSFLPTDGLPSDVQAEVLEAIRRHLDG